MREGPWSRSRRLLIHHAAHGSRHPGGYWHSQDSHPFDSLHYQDRNLPTQPPWFDSGHPGSWTANWWEASQCLMLSNLPRGGARLGQALLKAHRCPEELRRLTCSWPRPMHRSWSFARWPSRVARGVADGAPNCQRRPHASTLSSLPTFTWTIWPAQPLHLDERSKYCRLSTNYIRSGSYLCLPQVQHTF